MHQMIEELSQARQDYTSQRDQCAAQLQELDDEQAAYELEQAQMPPPSGIDYMALQVCAPPVPGSAWPQPVCIIIPFPSKFG